MQNNVCVAFLVGEEGREGRWLQLSMLCGRRCIIFPIMQFLEIVGSAYTNNSNTSSISSVAFTCRVSIRKF